VVPVSNYCRMRSGAVISLGTLISLILLLCFGRLFGWDATWRAFGVTPLQPPFFDMHVILDYASCAAKGFDAYVPHSCNQDNFNIPPIWLRLGYLGFDGTYSNWFSITIIAAALAVLVALLKGRSAGNGVLALAAILSPSVMMGVERGNLDLLILALVGAAALIYDERSVGRISWAAAVISAASALKLFPMFCVAIGVRCNRRALLFVSVVSVLSLVYLAAIFDDVISIRRNVPTTFILSYGYKAFFLGLDHLRTEAGLKAFDLADTWLPITAAIFTLILSAATAVSSFRRGRSFCKITGGVAGTAFLFGGGIYCGTFFLGTNFIYRLMFLLLCLPQFQDWRSGKSERGAQLVERVLYATVLSTLWLNGNATGHSSFLLVPQLINWLLFFGLAVALMSAFLNGLLSKALQGG